MHEWVLTKFNSEKKSLIFRYLGDKKSAEKYFRAVCNHNSNEERKCIREYFLTISVGKRVDNNDMKI